MGIFGGGSENRAAYDQLYDENATPEHHAKFSHELVGGGAGYFAMHEYEKRAAAEGHPVNHAKAKEALAGIAGAEVDRLFETKGLNHLDKERAKREAQQQATQLYEQQYGGRQEGGAYQ